LKKSGKKRKKRSQQTQPSQQWTPQTIAVTAKWIVIGIFAVGMVVAVIIMVARMPPDTYPKFLSAMLAVLSTIVKSQFGS
jgi:hypothetical protein